MKYVWILLCSIIFLVSVRSDTAITGQWILDWQSAFGYILVCFPANFTINSVNSTYYNMDLNFSPDVIKACSTYRVINSTSITLNLTFNSTSNLYTDGFGDQIIYDNVTQVLSYTLTEDNEDGTPGYNHTYYYTRTGQIIPQQEALGTINGLWISPVPANSSANHSGCCFPDRIWFDISLNNPDFDVGLDSVFYYDTSNCSSSVLNLTGGLQGNFSATTLTWSWGFVSTQTVSYSPLLNLTQVQLTAGTANCTYNYQRVNTGNYLNGEWQLDWQTNPGWSVPNTYQITVVNNTGAPYMATTFFNSTGYAYLHDYISENPNGLYYDHYGYNYIASFAYDNTTNTLLDSDLIVLFSPNGSLFNSSSFLTVWNNPQAVSSGSTDDCCMPTSINIIGFVNSYFAVPYYYIPDYANQSACEDVIDQISNNTVDSRITTIPNIHQLVWYDYNFNWTITYSPTASDPQITITSLSNPGQCTFTMNNLPSPKGSQRISFGAITVIIGVFLSFIVL